MINQPFFSCENVRILQFAVVVGTDTLKRRQFFQYFRPPPATPAGVRRLPEEVETEMKAVERGLGKLSYITIT